jgi:hypothetical protein
VAAEDDAYLLTSTVTYETPITQVEYLAGAESAVCDSDESIARMKTERGVVEQQEASNINMEEYDDYEMQERLSNESHMKSFNEDPNDSSS